MRKYSKALAAFVGAVGPVLVAALGDGTISRPELLQALVIGVVAAFTVWAAPKNADT